jgi:heme exporter protein D
MTEFFYMGGYGAYIWPAYGVAALVMIGLMVATLRSLKAREAELALLEADREKWGRHAVDTPTRDDPS